MTEHTGCRLTTLNLWFKKKKKRLGDCLRKETDPPWGPITSDFPPCVPNLRVHDVFLCLSACRCRHNPQREVAKESVKRLLVCCCCCYWHGPTWHESGASISHLAMSYHYLCLLLSDESDPASCWGAGLYLMGSFSRGFARRKPLTNPFKEESMDFMAPRALAPSFNKVKSKALSIRQWARGTVDAAVFNPKDATVHCMLGCPLIGWASSRSSHLGTFKFLWQSRFIVA